MLKLYNIFENLILENSSRSSVMDAIDRKYRVNIYYLGDDNTAAGKRTIEVYAFGLTKANNPVIRAYQIFGDTKTFVPAWKFFRLDRISRWEPTTFRFYTPISERDPSAPKFNPSGDKTMSTVYKIANFN